MQHGVYTGFTVQNHDLIIYTERNTMLGIKDKKLTELYFHQNDIEAKFGFRAAKCPDVNMFPAVIIALVVLGMFYAVIYYLVPESFIAEMFLERTSRLIPFLITLFSCLCLATILLKWAKLHTQWKAFQLRLFPDDPDFVLAEGNAREYLDMMRRCTDGTEHFILLCRVERALASLHNIGRVSDSVSMLESQAQTDEDELQSSYTLISGLIWGIPVLGFIGTVLGLSQSIGAFGKVLSSAEAEGIQALTESLRHVTAGLSTAFETTLEGLVAALFIQLLVAGLRKKEELFLDQCKEYCHRNIISRLRIVDFEEE